MNYKNKSFINKRKAFTLIELLIVIAIIGILFIVLVSKVDFATDKAKATGVQTDFRSFQVAFETVAKENAGFNTFGWDTGDTNGNRIRDSYDKGDTNKNGIQDPGEVFVGSKAYGETWTGIYTLTNPADANDKSAILALEAAINKNLDPKLHITINDDYTITMANQARDPWGNEYYGYYITNASVDGKDRGVILMYSGGANGEHGSNHEVVDGLTNIFIPGNNVYGKDDYAVATIYTYKNGYGEVKTTTSGFSNNQGNNASESINSDAQQKEPHTPNTLYYYQPYKFDYQNGCMNEVVFHEDGTIDVYYYEEDYEWGEIYIEEAYYEDGLVSFMGNIYTISEDGTILTPKSNPKSRIAAGPYMQPCIGILTSTSIKPLFFNVLYEIKWEDEEYGDFGEYGYVFNKDGSYLYLEYYMGIEDYRWDSKTYEYTDTMKYFDTYFENHYSDGVDDELYIDRCAIYPDGSKIILWGNIYNLGCVHKNTETKNIAPTCGKEGYNNAICCVNCKMVLGYKAIVPATEKHTWLDATCTMPKICSVCGIDDGQPNGHVFDATSDYCYICNAYKYNNFVVTSSNRHKVGYVGNENEVLIIPSKFYDEEYNRWYQVVEIANHAFGDCTNLTSVIIPETVKRIGAYSFRGCSNLIDVTIADGVTEISSGAFKDCTMLTTVNISENSQLKTIANDSFMYCSALKRMDFPDSLVSIGMQAFWQCYSLEEITFGNNLTTISYRAFCFCESLNKVSLPSSIRFLGSIYEPYTYDGGAFQWCTKLTELNIPDNTITILFGGTIRGTDIETFTVPEGVTIIDDMVFAECPNLKTIYMPSTLQSISGRELFTWSNETITIVYNGTMAQWNNISKHVDWDLNHNVLEIECLDGTIQLK